MKKFFVYCYEWEDGTVYIGRSNRDTKRFNNPRCYKPNPWLYEAMTTKPYKAWIIFESDDIWKVGKVEAWLIQCTYNHSFNINKETNWKYHIQKYIDRYLTNK